MQTLPPPTASSIAKPEKETSNGYFVHVAENIMTPDGTPILVELDKALAEVTAKVMEIGKEGSVVLSISILPWGMDKGDVPTFIVKGEVIPKKPKRKAKGQTFFLDDQGALSRQNANQMRLGSI